MLFALAGKPARSGLPNPRRGGFPPPAPRPPRPGWGAPVLVGGGFVLLLVLLVWILSGSGETPPTVQSGPDKTTADKSGKVTVFASHQASATQRVQDGGPDLPGLPSEYKFNNAYLKIKKSKAEYDEELRQNKMKYEAQVNLPNYWRNTGQVANTQGATF